MIALTAALLLPALALGAPYASPVSPPAPAHTLNPQWKFQHRLPTTPGDVVLYNFCNYDVWTWATKGAKAGEIAKVPTAVKVGAGMVAVIEDLKPVCDGACGTSVKISKTDQQVDVTQLEYSVSSENIVYYDISLINCVSGKDASKCPGWNEGLLVTGGEGFDAACERLECGAKEVCEKTAYFESLDLIAGASHPVKTCASKWGLNYALCAGNMK